MSKPPDHVGPSKQPHAAGKTATAGAAPVTKNDFLLLAALLGGKDNLHRGQRQDFYTKALNAAGELYEKREFVSAYESFQPVYDRIIADMQRVLARNAEFEANKVAKEQRKPLAAAKEYVQKMKSNAQQVVNQLERLLLELKSKPLVRMHLKKSGGAIAAPTKSAVEAATTTLNSANETRVDTHRAVLLEVASGENRYTKAPYAPPEKGALYAVRDKTGGERIIQVIAKSPDSAFVQVQVVQHGKPSNQIIQLAAESLARQAAKGWCHLLIPVHPGEAVTNPHQQTAENVEQIAMMRLDSQNFGRCCADIVRANIKFSTQLIKDVADGPFRAGNYEQAFLTFEQLAVGFNSAVANSRRAIADGRRALNAEKTNLSGKEIQDRTAAFTRSEQLIHTAEREFSTILEGLRMYLRAQQDTSDTPSPSGRRPG
jgi:hypothetical protein